MSKDNHSDLQSKERRQVLKKMAGAAVAKAGGMSATDLLSAMPSGAEAVANFTPTHATLELLSDTSLSFHNVGHAWTASFAGGIREGENTKYSVSTAKLVLEEYRVSRLVKELEEKVRQNPEYEDVNLLQELHHKGRSIHWDEMLEKLNAQGDSDDLLEGSVGLSLNYILPDENVVSIDDAIAMEEEVLRHMLTAIDSLADQDKRDEVVSAIEGALEPDADIKSILERLKGDKSMLSISDTEPRHDLDPSLNSPIAIPSMPLKKIVEAGLPDNAQTGESEEHMALGHDVPEVMENAPETVSRRNFFKRLAPLAASGLEGSAVNPASSEVDGKKPQPRQPDNL